MPDNSDATDGFHKFEEKVEQIAPEPVAPEKSGVDRLRAFEDETVGKEAVRIAGRIERGSGSFYQTKMTPEQRKHHTALENLIAAEHAVASAKTALALAEGHHAAAAAAVDADPVG